MRAVCLATAVLVVPACTAASEEVRPPDTELFFPTGVAVSPDESVLFAISANSELRYDSGTVLSFDLAAVDAVIDAWLVDGTFPERCERDLTFPESLDCEEAVFLVEGGGVRIGNFATSLAIQDKGGGNLRLVIPVRGDPSVTYADWDAEANELACGDSEAAFPLCSDQHRLSRFLDDPDLPQISPEPYGVYVDSVGEWGMVTHLTEGTVTLVDLPIDGEPVLADALGGLFAANVSGLAGSYGVAGRTPGDPENLVYVTSLTEERVQTFTVARIGDGYPSLIPSDYFFLRAVGTTGGASENTRGVAFGAGGDLGYFMNRFPPSLTVLDTSANAQGRPDNRIVAATDICREASNLTVGDVGEGERVFITCFQDGELYVVDPRAGAHVEAVGQVGRGPFSVAIAPNRRRLFVSNFFENSIAVIDLTPGAPTQYRVVARIGMPNQ